MHVLFCRHKLASRLLTRQTLQHPEVNRAPESTQNHDQSFTFAFFEGRGWSRNQSCCQRTTSNSHVDAIFYFHDNRKWRRKIRKSAVSAEIDVRKLWSLCTHGRPIAEIRLAQTTCIALSLSTRQICPGNLPWDQREGSSCVCKLPMRSQQ